MITIVFLSTQPNPFETLSLMGKPVWKRTFEATAFLKPRRVAWMGKNPPVGMATIKARDLTAIRGSLLFITPEIGCISGRTLKRFVSFSPRSSRALLVKDSNFPVAIATVARSLNTKVSSLRKLAAALQPKDFFGAEEELLTVNSAESWAKALGILRQRKISALLRRGVLISDPSSVFVDPEVSVSPGTILSPWVRIEGSSRIAKGCNIGSFSHLVNCSIGPGTTILDHCIIHESRVGKGASIGPFAHLRPASDIGADARVGNFVEMKKSSLGPGAKVPHLSYVGDAQVGRNANLGAGLITCNYDGVSKHRTVVGEGAFIGSDTQLVAPVRIGKGAYIAAGSCIVQDVPAFALALTRNRQIIKKDWAKKRHKRS